MKTIIGLQNYASFKNYRQKLKKQKEYLIDKSGHKPNSLRMSEEN